MAAPESSFTILREPSLAGLKPAEYLALARHIKEGGETLRLQPLRVAFLSTFFIGFVEPYLIVEGARQGLAVRTYYGAFGQLEQELADPQAALGTFDPEVLVIAMRPEDVEPDAVIRYYASEGRQFGHLTRTLCKRIADGIELFRMRSAAPVLVANFAAPAEAPLRVFDANAPGSLTSALDEANQLLRTTVGGHAGAVIWDYCGLVRACGTAEWVDRRLWSLARAPVSPKHQPALARHLIRTFCGVLRPPAKCLVLDLDNTLWGGVVADDGLEGIQIGGDHPGLGFAMFQRAVLGLRDRGVLLAIASKNQPEVAEQVFREHPEMLLRWHDFAAVRVGWQPKSQSLREIASELNIGTDALVFFDDNPVERAEVRANAPEVTVIEVPSDPLRYETALFECTRFDAILVTREDIARAELYRQEGERRHLQQRAANVEEFLADLGMVGEIGRVGPLTLARIAQLVAKTNQFNLTTRRYSVAEIEAMGSDPAAVVAWLRLRDRFGDAGLVAAAIVRKRGEEAVIDTFVMSCRVMGRHVEQALLAYLAEEARGLGCTRLIGEYIPTPKNVVVEGLFADMGFQKLTGVGGTGACYRLDLSAGSIDWPAVIRRIGDAEPLEVTRV